MTASLTTKKRAEMIAGRMRGIPGRIEQEMAVPAVPVLADILPLRRPVLPAPAGEFATCRLDQAGRIRLTGISEYLGWSPGELTFEVRGEWVLIGPGATKSTAGCQRRQVVRLDATDRITLPHAVRSLIRTKVDESVLTMTLPGTNQLALINPAAVLLGAPLA